MSVRPIIYSPLSSRRLEYVCEWIFGDLAGVDYEITRERPDPDLNDPVITYGVPEDFGQSIAIQMDGGLEESTLPAPPGDHRWTELPDDGRLPDIFHFVFYHLSRVDERDTNNLDKHGRIISANTWLGRHDLLREPVVDVVVDHLFKRINGSIGHQAIGFRTKSVSEMTIDVDQLFAYRRKPMWRQLGSLMRDVGRGHFQRISDRLGAVLASGRDPYDRLSWMLDQIRKRGLTSRTFFLVGGLSRFDRQVKLEPGDLSVLADRTTIGLHPSYMAGEDPALLMREKEVLEGLVNDTVTSSRFHYLRLKVPEYYHNLLATGITEDYTLCWSDNIGFRAGTGHSFHYYDIDKEEVTGLRLFPVLAMDVILKNTLGFPPEVVVDELKHVVGACHQYGGEARVIWHNSSFDPTESWTGWDNVFEGILDLLTIK